MRGLCATAELLVNQPEYWVKINQSPLDDILLYICLVCRNWAEMPKVTKCLNTQSVYRYHPLFSLIHLKSYINNNSAVNGHATVYVLSSDGVKDTTVKAKAKDLAANAKAKN